MTNLAIGLIVIAIVFVPLAAMAYFAAVAPLGYENEDGFFYGEPDEHSDNDNLGS